MKRYDITGFQTTDRMKDDTALVFGGEYNVPVDFDAPKVLDIGACHGAFAFWAKARWEGAQVFCYEPAADAIKLLVENLEGHGVEIIPAAVSASGRGMMPLYQGKYGEGANSLYRDVVPVTEDVEYVPVMHPNKLPPCDVLKMDCEGAEWEIAENYQHWDGVKAVLMEYHTQENFTAIDSLLIEKGFRRLVHRTAVFGLGVACYVHSEPLQAFYEQFEQRVLIVSPIYQGDGHPQFNLAVQTTLDALKEEGVYAGFASINGDADIDRARAGLLGQFLAEPYWTHLLMVDADVEWHPTVVSALLKHGVPCVGAAYTFKVDSGPLKDLPVIRSWGEGSSADSRGLANMRFLAGGFILCERDLLVRMCEAEPDLKFDTNPGHGAGYQMETYALWRRLFIDQPEWGEGKREMLSEDYSFCERVNRLGETCWLDVYAQLAHWDGDKAYILKDRPEKAA